MMALRTQQRERLNAALALGREHGQVDIASHPAPDEWALAGELTALRAIMTRFGGTHLAVEGAWHSPAMAGAARELGAALRNVQAPALRARFVSNRDGTVVTDAQRIVELMVEQLTRPVQWVAVLERLAGCGVTDFVTVGTGRVLKTLLRRTLGSRVRVHATDEMNSLRRTVEVLSC